MESLSKSMMSIGEYLVTCKNGSYSTGKLIQLVDDLFNSEYREGNVIIVPVTYFSRYSDSLRFIRTLLTRNKIYCRLMKKENKLKIILI